MVPEIIYPFHYNIYFLWRRLWSAHGIMASMVSAFSLCNTELLSAVYAGCESLSIDHLVAHLIRGSQPFSKNVGLPVLTGKWKLSPCTLMTGSTVRLGPHSKQAFRSNLLTPYPDAQFLLRDKHSKGTLKPVCINFEGASVYKYNN